MHSSVSFNILNVDGTMKIGMGVRRYVAKRAVHSDPAVLERLRVDRSRIG